MVINNFALTLQQTFKGYQDTDIIVVNNDASVNQLTIEVYNAGVEITYSELSTGTITFVKDDGNIVQGNLTINAGNITYLMGTNEIAIPGLVRASIQLYGASNERLTPAKFTFHVDEDLSNVNATQSTTDLIAIQELIADVGVYKGEIDAHLADNADFMINIKHPPAPIVAAKVDGATDDHAALAGCIEYVRAAGGGKVLVPDGICLVTGNIPAKSNVTIIGASQFGSIIKLKGGYSGKWDQSQVIPPIFNQEDETVSISGFSIKNITLDGNKANQTIVDKWEWSHGLSLVRYDNLHIENVYFKGFQGDGAELGTSFQWDSAIVPTIIPCENTWIEKCIFEDCFREGILLIHNKKAWIKDNIFKLNPDVACIDIETHHVDDVIQDVWIENNWMECTGTGTRRGIVLLCDNDNVAKRMNMSNIHVKDNTLINMNITNMNVSNFYESNNELKISLQGDTWTANNGTVLLITAGILCINVNTMPEGSFGNGEITNNRVCIGSTIPAAVRPILYGIANYHFKDMDISNNYVEYAKTSGIYCMKAFRGHITNNHIYNIGAVAYADSEGIHVQDNCKSTKIIGNTIWDDRGAGKLCRVGIGFADDAIEPYVVLGNSIKGMVTQSIKEVSWQIYYHMYGTNIVEDHFKEVMFGATTMDPASISANSSIVTYFGMTGAAMKDFVQASFSLTISNVVLTAYVSQADLISIVWFNPTTNPIDIAEGTLTLKLTKR